jgi:hypothetical protein
VKVTEFPAQTSVADGVTVQTGLGLTINRAVHSASQPRASVSTLVYIPEADGWALLNVIVWFVETKPPGPRQLNAKGGVPPVTLTVKLALDPAHISACGGRIVQTGGGLRINRASQLFVQPSASVTTTL